MPLGVLRGQQLPGDRWRPEDAALAVALTDYEAGLCPGCGHPLADTTSPDADPENRDGDFSFVAHPPRTCWGCVGLAQAAKSAENAGDEPHPYPSALRYATSRVDYPQEPQDVTDST